jgi:nucleotidyltransferase/DNA polymerase involved in DNA repair
MFALVDCNNFYASCERVFNPKLDKETNCYSIEIMMDV